MLILYSCLVYLLDWHVLRDIHQYLYYIYPYIHAMYGFILVFLFLVTGQPICNKIFLAPVYVLFWPCIDVFQKDVLNFLWQGCYVFLKYSHQGFTICCNVYIPGKTVMMTFLRPCSIPSASLSALVKLLQTADITSVCVYIQLSVIYWFTCITLIG